MSLLVDRLCQKFREEWSSGRPDLRGFLSSLSEQERSQAASRLIEIDVSLRFQAGEKPSPEDYRECLSDDELSRLSSVFEVEAFTKSTGARGIEQTWRDGAVDAPPIKRRLIGRYRVLGILGEGAFGTVYRAQDDSLSREVAVKVPRIGSSDTASVVDSLLREAQAAAKVSHPNIVTVHDCGRLEEGDCFVVFEFIPGGHLGHELFRSQPSIERAVELMIQIAEGVHHAHMNGLFHRDLKPANILIGPDGTPKIADFGLVVIEDRQFESRGEVTGTPSYMSPEQTRGEAHLLDGRSDIWSLGVILYEMLTSRRPFIGRDIDELFERIQRDTVRPLRQINDAIPKELDTICRKCLRTNPEQRYSTAGDLARDLRAFQSQNFSISASKFEATGSFKAISKSEVAPERVHTTKSKLTPPRKRTPVAVKVSLTGLVAAAGIFWGSEILDRDREPRPAPPALPASVPIHLLSDRPTVFAWNRDDDALPPLFDPQDKAFSIRHSGGHLYAIVGGHPLRPFRLMTAISIDQGWRGFGGVLWGIRDSDDRVHRKLRKCFALRLFRTRASEPPVLRLDEVTFANSDSVEWKEILTQELSRVEVSEPLGRVVSLEVAVDRKTLSVRFNDQPLNGKETWDPKLPDFLDTWMPAESFALGITGKGNLAVISQLQVADLDL